MAGVKNKEIRASSRGLVRRSELVFFVSLSAVLGGCGPQSGEGQGWQWMAAKPKQAVKAPARPAASAPGGIRYVYPAEAPVVDAMVLERLLGGFRGQELLVFVWRAEDWPARVWLQELARVYASRRGENLRVLTVAVGQPHQWQGVVGLLKEAGTNFPCVMMLPDSNGAAGHLFGGAAQALPVCVAIDRNGKMVGQVDSLEGLGGLGSSSGTRVASVVGKRGSEAWEVRGRLLDISTGKTVERFRASGDLKKVTEALVEQIMAELSESSAKGGVAISGFRGDDKGGKIGKRLAEEMRKQVDRKVLGPAETRAVLREHDLHEVTVELNPREVAGKVDWAYLVVGVVERPGDRRTAKRGKPSEGGP